MNLFNVLSAVKGKVLAGAILVLVTLLSTSVALNCYQQSVHTDMVEQHAQTVMMNDSLVSSNKSLRDQLKELPKQLDTVKSIDMELCRGLLDVKDVLNLPAISITDTQESKEDEKNEKAYVDIDAPLPPALVKLLNED